MATVFQRVMRLMSPLGRGKRALQRMLGGGKPKVAASEQPERPWTTETMVVDGNAAEVAGNCQMMIGDIEPPFEILVAGIAAEVARIPLMHEVRRLVAQPDVDASVEMQRMVHGEPMPESTLPCYQASDLDPNGAKPLPDGEPFVLRFDEDVDAPYRFRAWLAEPHVHAFATDAATAERVALLAGTASTPCGLQTLRSKESQHVVLQADNFTEGGMEQVVIDLAEALHLEGFTTSLLILGEEGTAAQRARDRGLQVDRMPADVDGYVAYLEKTKAALVNAHYSTFGADLCAARGVPFVQTVHNMYMWFGPPQVDAYRTADAHTAAYVCVSNNVARYADRTIGLSPSRMLVIPNGCDDGFRPTDERRAAADELRGELGMPKDAKVFLNVGSIQPPKAQHLLLAAFAQVREDHPEAHLVFLGGPADELYYQEQRKTTERLGLGDCVHWVGRRPDVQAFHQLACALVQPSFFEGWSLAITEAVLAELPVIATDVGGAVEQLRGTDGILLPAAVPDITAINSDSLMPMLNGTFPELIGHIADACRTVLRRGAGRSRMPEHWPAFLRDVAYQRVAEVYHWLCAGGRAGQARYWLRAPVEPADGSR